MAPTGGGPVAAAAEAEALAELVKGSPHCAQLLAPLARPFLGQAAAGGGRRLEEGDRFLSAACPRMKYERRPDSERSSCHWGQLKLLESEMKCLLELVAGPSSAPRVSRGYLVVYAGAAPGVHLLSIIRRFPCCRFQLYDPASFDARLVDFAASAEGKGRLTLVNDFFSDETARQIAARERTSAFFSDIRTADPAQMQFDEVEGYVEKDMVKQKEWARILRPRISVLKFRLPWRPGATRYLRGKVLVQAFPPCTSTESRLVVPLEALEDAEVLYDHDEYGEQFMHHNTVTRACLYEHGVKLPGLDKCYDCAALAQTVRCLLEARPLLGASAAANNSVPAVAVSANEVAAEIAALIKELGHTGRTLKTLYHVSSSRHGGRHFAKRSYYDSHGNDRFSQDEPSQPARKARKTGYQESS